MLKSRLPVLFALATALALGAGSAPAGGSALDPGAAVTSQGEGAIGVTPNVTYKAGLQLDVYRPGTLTGRPALVLVHGGGWMGGDKAGTNQVETARAFARRGFVVFSVNHSLNPVGNRTPNFRQPPIDDVADAVEWVRANAATYGADGTKVAALGQSSGGHLALMVALTKAGNEKPDAVLCWSAPTRLEDFDFTPAAGSREQLVVDYIGVDDLTNAAFDTFSPYYQSLPSSPPIRLVHSQDEGDNAYGVPVSNADDMHAALVAAGRDSTKVIEPGNVHADFIDDTDAGADWLESKLDVATNVRTIPVAIPVAVAGDDGYVEQAGTAYGGTDGGWGVDLTFAQLLVRNSRTTFGAPFTFIRGNTVLRFADTVALPDDAAIASASLFIRTSATEIVNADARNLQIEWIADPGTIDTGDFSAVPAATAKAATPLSGLAPSVGYEWPLLNPAANVSKTAPTGLRLHVDGGEPTGQNHVLFVAFNDATLDGPELLVVYSEPTRVGAGH